MKPTVRASSPGWIGALAFVCCGCALSACAAEPHVDGAPAASPLDDDTPTQTRPDQSDDNAIASPLADNQLTAGDWLDRLENKARALDTLAARIRYVTVQGLLQDEQTRFGDLSYDLPNDGKPERFAVHFDRERIDDEISPTDRWLIFDGHWLLDRDHGRRQATRRELVRPDAGSNGQGGVAWRFPAAIDRADIEARYEVALLPEAEAKPGLVGLDLKPRQPDGDSPMQVWFDPDDLVVVHAVFVDDDGDQTEVIVARFEENAELDESLFETTPPQEANWDVQIVPLEDAGDGPPALLQ